MGWLRVPSLLEHHFPSPALLGSRMLFIYRGCSLQLWAVQAACSPPAPCSDEAVGAPGRAEAAQERSQEVSPIPRSCGKGRGGRSGHREGGDLEARDPLGKAHLIPSTCPQSKEPTQQITALQRSPFPVTGARQQPGQLSLPLLPPFAPHCGSEIGLAPFPRLCFTAAHVPGSAAQAPRPGCAACTVHWHCCTNSQTLPQHHL